MLKKLLTLPALLCAVCAFAQVDANQATLAELDAVKGIGPELSQRILAQRNKAIFLDWPDLIGRVHGLGNASAAKFSANGLTVNGKAFAGASGPAKASGSTAAVDPLEKPHKSLPSTPP